MSPVQWAEHPQNRNTGQGIELDQRPVAWVSLHDKPLSLVAQATTALHRNLSELESAFEGLALRKASERWWGHYGDNDGHK